MMTKSEFRKTAKARRAAVFSQNAALEIISYWPREFAGKSVAGYWPLQSEIDPRPLMTALAETGADLALPCITAKAAPLIFRRWRPADVLTNGPFGTLEPTSSALLMTPDIVLVPLLAYGEQGERLGYGGGFYDRTLAVLKTQGQVFACGLAFDGQKAAQIPTDRHDIRLDGLLTETGFRKFV